MDIRNSLLLLVLAAALAGCGSELTSPDPVAVASASKEAPGMELDLSTRPQQPRGARGSRGVQLLDEAGNPGTWAIVRRDGSTVDTYPTLDDALDVYFATPRWGVGVAFLLDFNSQVAFGRFLDDMSGYFNGIWGDPHVNHILEQAKVDLTLLTADELAWYRRVYLPLSQVQAQLDQVAASMAGPAKVWGVLKAFVQALFGEDNRFGDEDGDGVFNVSDDDYRGTLWSAGHITVTADGGNHDIWLNPCFDPCPIPDLCNGY